MKVNLGDKTIEQVDCFNHLHTIINKDTGSREDVKKIEFLRPIVFFDSWKKFEKIGSLGINTRVLEAVLMIAVQNSSETCVLRKPEEDLLNVLQRNCLRVVLRARLTDRISNDELYRKCSSTFFGS